MVSRPITKTGLILMAVGSLTACSAASTAPPELGGKRLTGPEIRELVAGNTETYPAGAIYYKPDGTAIHEKTGGVGTWRISADDRMCQDLPHRKEEFCFIWSLDGEKLFTYTTEGNFGSLDGESRIELGDPRNLAN